MKLFKPFSSQTRSRLGMLIVAMAAVSLMVPAVNAIVSGGRWAAEEPTPVQLIPNGRRVLHIPADQPAQLLPRVEMEKGKSIVVTTGFDLERVAIADPNTANLVMTDARTIQLIALQPGSTNLLLWDQKGSPQAAVDVFVGATHSQVQLKLRELLDTEDIHVEMAGTETIVLRGTAASLEARERAQLLALAFMDQGSIDREYRVVNLLDVLGNHQVMLKVRIAEMNKSLGKQMEINYQGMATAGAQAFTFGSLVGGAAALAPDGQIGNALAGNDGNDLFGSYTSQSGNTVDAFLKFAKDKGLAKILAEPTLVARSGERASFLAGGEVPVPVPGGTFGQVSIEFKQFGVGVEFVPTVISPSRIHLEVTPEVSEPDPTIGVEVLGTAVPGFSTRRASTAVELADGQSFVVAGLLQDRTRTMARKVPWLGEVPVLGALFRSQDYQKAETELMIIVTPHLVKALGPGPQPLPTDHYRSPSDADFFALGRDEGKPKKSESQTVSAKENEEAAITGGEDRS